MNSITRKIWLLDWARTRRLCGFDDRVALSVSPRRFVVSADVLMLIILLYPILIGVNISGILVCNNQNGPSAASTVRSRPTFSSNQQPSASREVEPAAPAKPPPLRNNDMHIRANSGMYADREQQAEIGAGTDAAHRGPRAVTNGMPPRTWTP
jgi:hypothetical protein